MMMEDGKYHMEAWDYASGDTVYRGRPVATRERARRAYARWYRRQILRIRKDA